MSGSEYPYLSPPRRRLGAFGLIGALQAVCATFFLLDVTGDIFRAGLTPHLFLESACVVALICGTMLAAMEIRTTLKSVRRGEETRRFLSGAFGSMFMERCDEWRLTPAETEVALFVLKGFDPCEIAEYRGTAGGTVRAQLAAIYAKSGSSGRGQFVSAFIDALLDFAKPTVFKTGPAKGRSDSKVDARGQPIPGLVRLPHAREP